MTQEILVIYGMIECHSMAKHKACYFTGSQNYATLNEELIFIDWKVLNSQNKLMLVHKSIFYEVSFGELVIISDVHFFPKEKQL